MMRRMNGLANELNAYRLQHDLSYEALAMRFAAAGFKLSTATLFLICTDPRRKLLERTERKVRKFLGRRGQKGAQ